MIPYLPMTMRKRRDSVDITFLNGLVSGLIDSPDLSSRIEFRIQIPRNDSIILFISSKKKLFRRQFIKASLIILIYSQSR